MLSIFLIIYRAHWTDAAINWSVRGLPWGPPKSSSAVCMCWLARIAAMIPNHALAAVVHPDSYNLRLAFATSGLRIDLP